MVNRSATPAEVRRVPNGARDIALRKRHGLPDFESLSHQLCFGDSVLYPDIPALCPLSPDAPASHHFLGAVQWSPRVAAPKLVGDAALPMV